MLPVRTSGTGERQATSCSPASNRAAKARPPSTISSRRSRTASPHADCISDMRMFQPITSRPPLMPSQRPSGPGWSEHAVVGDGAGAAGEFEVVGEHHAALTARGHVLVLTEAEGGDVSVDRSSRPPGRAIDWAQSSTTKRPCLSASAMTASMSQAAVHVHGDDRPRALRMRSAMLAGSMLSVSRSMSAKTGTALSVRGATHVATKVSGARSPHRPVRLRRRPERNAAQSHRWTPPARSSPRPVGEGALANGDAPRALW